MPDEPGPDPEVEKRKDPFAELREKTPDFGEYDERALDQYRSLSFYFHQRADRKLSRPVSARLTCENFGHDAPRGMCLRCGLGVDLTAESKKERERVVQRQEWLTARH